MIVMGMPPHHSGAAGPGGCTKATGPASIIPSLGRRGEDRPSPRRVSTARPSCLSFIVILSAEAPR